MEIHLVNFRCYKDRRFSIPRGVNLIDGPSGKGKSTLLNAIKYALFGNLQKVCSHGEKKTTVTLTYDDLHMTRTNIPSRLVVRHQEQVYEDDAAQELITRRFGTSFEITSYMVQKGSSQFFSMSGSEKLAFLEELALHGEESIRSMKQSIQAEIKDIRTKLLEEQSQSKLLERMVSERPSIRIKKGVRSMTDVQSLLSLAQRLVVYWKEERTKTDKNVDSYRNKQQQQQVQRTAYDVFFAMVERLGNEKSRVEIECQRLFTCWSEDDLIRFETVRQSHEKWMMRTQKQERVMDMQQRYQQLVQHEQASIRDELQRLDSQQLQCEDHEEELVLLLKTYREAIEQDTYYHAYQEIVSQWEQYVQQLETRMTSDRVNQQQEIESLTTQRVVCTEDIPLAQRTRDELINQRSIAKRRRDMESELALDKYKECSTKLDTTRKNIEKVKQFLSEMDIRKCVLSCPGCKKNVMMKQQQLFLADHHPVSETDRSRETDFTTKLPLLVKQEETLQRLVVQRDTILRDLHELPSSGTEEEIEQQIRDWTQRIERAQQIQQSNAVLDRQIKDKQKHDDSRYVHDKDRIKMLEAKRNTLPVGCKTNISPRDVDACAKRLQQCIHVRQTNEWIQKQMEQVQSRSPEKKYISLFTEWEEAQSELERMACGEQCTTIEVVMEEEKKMKQAKYEYDTQSILLTELTASFVKKQHERDQFVLDQTDYEALLDRGITHQRWITEKLQSATDAVQSYTEYAHQLQRYIQYKLYKSSLYEKQRCCSLYLIQLERLETLHHHVIQAEGVCLEQFIRRVNVTMKWYLEQFFPDQSVTMELDSEKESKNGKIRHEICVHVLYHHFPCELKGLSGGEYDRCALAFMLAINELSHSPCLFLDESISSLDMSLSEDVLEVLKEKQTQLSKIVLLISHQANTGFFDHVITI